MPNIQNSFFEDDKENIHFLYTGRDNVLGLKYPESSLLNNMGYSYIRIGTIIPDPTALSSDLITVDEMIDIVGISGNEDDDVKSVSAEVFIHGLIKNKRVVDSSFKCVYTPLSGNIDSEIIDIYLTEEVISDNYGVAIWLKTDNFLKVYTAKVFNKSRDGVPINSEFLDSLYDFNILQNSGLDSTVGVNSIAVIDYNKIAKGVSIYDSLLKRLTIVEGVAQPKFQYCYAVYPESFIPNYGTTDYQIVSPSSLMYTAVTSPFISVTSDRNAISVKENGTYQLQLTTGIKGGDALSNQGNIELALYVGDSKNPIVNAKRYIQDKNSFTLSTGFTVMDLSPSDKIYIKLKLGSPSPNSLILSDTYLSILRIL